MRRKCKVAVGMSGGIDSAVTLWFLTERNYFTAGFYIGSWNVFSLDSEWFTVMVVTQIIGSQSFLISLTNLYWKHILNNLIEAHETDEIPNPDILCNWYIKFGAVLSCINYFGYDIFSTGHYARMWQSTKQNKKVTRPADLGRDQTYFLYLLNTKSVPPISFPLGNIKKAVIRFEAVRSNFPNALKKDSHGICFVNPDDHTTLLIGLVRMRFGPTKTKVGHILGEHIGTAFYSAGQKRLLGIRLPSQLKKKMWVQQKKSQPDEILVTTKKLGSQLVLCFIFFRLLTNAVLSEQIEMFSLKIRSQQYKERFCSVYTFQSGDRIPINLFSYSGPNIFSGFVISEVISSNVTPGQHLVLYDQNFSLGGGQIVGVTEVS